MSWGGTFVAFDDLFCCTIFLRVSSLLLPAHWCCFVWFIPDWVLERTFIPFLRQCLVGISCRDFPDSILVYIHIFIVKGGLTSVVLGCGLWGDIQHRSLNQSCNAKLDYAVVFCRCILMTVRLSDPRRFQSSTVGVGHLRAEKACVSVDALFNGWVWSHC